MDEILNSVVDRIGARVPLLYARTKEDERVADILEEAQRYAASIGGKTKNRSWIFLQWSLTDGFCPLVRPMQKDDDENLKDQFSIRREEAKEVLSLLGKEQGDEEGFRNAARDILASLDMVRCLALENARKGAKIGLGRTIVFLFKDLGDIIDSGGNQRIDPTMVRLLKDLYVLLPGKKIVVVFTGTGIVPMELSSVVEVLEVPKPAIDSLEKLTEAWCTNKWLDQTNDGKECTIKAEVGVADALRGLSLAEAKLALRVATVQGSGLVKRDVVLERKIDQIKKYGHLEVIPVADTMDDVGGLDVLKIWLSRVSNAFSSEARSCGVRPPRGVILVGPPGTGKSLTAKAVGRQMGLPVLRLDMSGIVSQWYGRTTQIMSEALVTVDAFSPAILLIDEIEKALASGMGGVGSGHEETLRMLGTLLTWMEETKSDVFMVATSNTQQGLKPEVMNRFSRTYFVDLPTEEERMDIFRIHLRKAGFNPSDDCFDLKELAEGTNDWNGREIRNLITDAKLTAFTQIKETGGKLQLTGRMIVKELKNIKPIAEQRASEINSLRDWAKKCALPTSSKSIIGKESVKFEDVVESLGRSR